MNPTPEDTADVLSANLRTMREFSDKLEATLGIIWILELATAVLIGCAAYYVLTRVLHGTQ